MDSPNEPAQPPARVPDKVAIFTIVAGALVSLLASWMLPWWRMESRAPQYGQRVLVIEVNPAQVWGDQSEIDSLGHYVGIRKMGTVAALERKIAPLGLIAGFTGFLLAPWLRRRLWRLAVLLPVLLLPAIFLVDLQYWTDRSANDRDPEAALSLTVKRIEAKIAGHYEVGQFKVDTRIGSGLYVVCIAGLLGVGLIFSAPLQWRSPRSCCAAAAALLLVTALPRAAPAAELVVRENGSIATALAAARDGDTVLVSPGVYREHVTVSRRLRLVGLPGAVLDGGGKDTIVRVSATGVEVRGLTLRNSGDSYMSEDAGIRVENADDVRIAATRIEDTLFGAFLVKANRAVIEGCTVIGKDLPHVRRGDGIRLWYSSGCKILGNQVERSRDVVIWYSADALCEDNVVRTSRYGLHFMYSDRNVFRRNRFEDDQVGAAIMYSKGLELTDNSFSYSNGVAAYGLLVKDADDIFITGNRFVDNSTAVFLDNAPMSRKARAVLHRNLIARNDVGLAMQPLTKRVEIWENSMIGNRIQVQVVGTGSVEDNAWAVGGRGNYWSDAVPYDADGDGISELPYRSESTYEVLADRFPQLAFYAGTPAAEAIDLASRMFPIFAARPKFTDPHPLCRPAAIAWQTEPAPPGANDLAAAGGAMLALCSLGAVLTRLVV